MTEEEIEACVSQLDAEHRTNLAVVMGGSRRPQLLGDGWTQIVADMCSRLYGIAPETELRIRSGDGQLRVLAVMNHDRPSALCQGIITRAVDRSRRMCEVCGSRTDDLTDIAPSPEYGPVFARLCIEHADFFQQR